PALRRRMGGKDQRRGGDRRAAPGRQPDPDRRQAGRSSSSEDDAAIRWPLPSGGPAGRRLYPMPRGAAEAAAAGLARLADRRHPIKYIAVFIGRQIIVFRGLILRSSQY